MPDPNDPRAKICPLILVARIANPKKPQKQDPSVFTCMGPGCAWWVHALDGVDLTWQSGCALMVLGQKTMEGRA